MSRKIWIQVIINFAYFVFGMTIAAGAVFVPNILAELNITGKYMNVLSANMTTAFTFAKIIGSFATAFMLKKFGIKWGVAISLFLISLGVLMPSIPQGGLANTLLIAVRFISGLGGSLVLVFFNPISVSFFDEKQRSVVNGINGFVLTFGILLILFFSDNLLELFGWKTVFYGLSIASILSFVAWILVYKDPEVNTNNISSKQPTIQNKVETKKYSFIDGLKDKFVWAVTFTYSGTLVVFTFAYSFYKAAGLAIVGKYTILGCLFGFIAGIIYAKKVKNRLNIVKISGLFITLSLILVHVFSRNSLLWLHNETVQIIASLAVGFFFFLPNSSLVSYSQERKDSTPQQTSILFSIYWGVSYVLTTVIVYVYNFIADANKLSTFVLQLPEKFIKANSHLGSLAIKATEHIYNVSSKNTHVIELASKIKGVVIVKSNYTWGFILIIVISTTMVIGSTLFLKEHKKSK